MSVFAIVFINLALVFYTVGVWGEKLQKTLKLWHVVVFWLGLICDTLGTTAMGEIAGGLIQMNFHSLTGLLAIVLMIIHAVWATLVLVKNNEKMKVSFHKFSIIVWLLWLVPMFSPMILRILT